MDQKVDVSSPITGLGLFLPNVTRIESQQFILLNKQGKWLNQQKKRKIIFIICPKLYKEIQANQRTKGAATKKSKSEKIFS